MIRVDRGAPDAHGAQELAALEAKQLAAMRALRVKEQRDPTSEELGDGYRIVAELLWRRQHRKCAYCEHTEQRRRNDVEHFRPKARARRGPQHTQTHGYWWLAWRWDNLLFACRNCNQPMQGDRGKGDHFPLAAGSGVLTPEQDPYGADATIEAPLLLDPSRESGVDHLEFRRTVEGGLPQWRPYARGGSLRGFKTIEVCALDRDDLRDLYNDHVATVVQPAIDEWNGLHPFTSAEDRERRWRSLEERLLGARAPFVGLSFDALRHLGPSDSELAEWGILRRKPA